LWKQFDAEATRLADSGEAEKAGKLPVAWFRMGRILAERGPKPEVHAALTKILRENPDDTRQLRALWALHITQNLPADRLLPLLDHAEPYVRGWAIQLLGEDRNYSPAALAKFTASAVENRGRATEESKEAFFAAGYDEANMIDVIIVIGDKIISNYLHNLTGFDIDFPIADKI